LAYRVLLQVSLLMCTVAGSFIAAPFRQDGPGVCCAFVCCVLLQVALCCVPYIGSFVPASAGLVDPLSV
jgi:hypothetical protein